MFFHMPVGSQYSRVFCVFLFSIYCWCEHSRKMEFLEKILFKHWSLPGLWTYSISKIWPQWSMLVEVGVDWASSAVVYIIFCRPARHSWFSVLFMVIFLNGGHWSFAISPSICFLQFYHWLFHVFGKWIL